MKTAKKKSTVPTLEDRLDAIHEELNAVIDAHVDSIASVTPSVPRGVIDQMIRKSRCACNVFRTIREMN